MTKQTDIIDAEWRETDDAAIVKADERVLARLGTPEQRRAALVVLAQSLKIPQDAFDTDPNLHGSLALAIQYAGEYGFIPGVHFHAVERTQTVNNEKIKTYVIQDGEKAWKDSAMRLGIQYRFQDRVMSRDDILKVAKSIGCPENQVSSEAAGVWSRVITREDVDWGLVTDESPIWQAGIWLGVTRSGKYWNADNLPTGTTPTDVATRRAHKRALMSSVVTLTKLDDRRPEERYAQLTTSLVHEAEHRAKVENMGVAQRMRVLEDDGDELFAPPQPFVTPEKREQPAPAEEAAAEFVVEAWRDWTEPANAYAWATGQGIDEADAKAIYAQMVSTVGKGKHSEQTMPAIFKAFWESVREKAQAAQAVPA